MTALPAASAALTWPAKIASGKFHGEIATIGPTGAAVDTLRSVRTCAA